MNFSKYFIFFGLIISFGNVRGGLTKNVENFMNSSKLNNFNFTNFNLNDNNQLQALAQIGQTFVNNSFWQMQIGLALSTGTAFFLYAFIVNSCTENNIKSSAKNALSYFFIPTGAITLHTALNWFMFQSVIKAAKI
ncbi:hypothetical protein IPH25_03730 [bacterium]|nr:MAG: hypothetical protein IPG37_00725 [bacterium]QQR61563.1 MAG: hypothetical protein IPH25_03730 [bacterium]QQR62903.1 MAG: hypothetical protein IPH67_00225 [bacterium]